MRFLLPDDLIVKNFDDFNPLPKLAIELLISLMLFFSFEISIVTIISSIS